MADEFQSCSVEGCKANAHWRARGSRGWCNAHYIRWRKYGDPVLGGESRARAPVHCTVDGCSKKPKANGLCNAHYFRSVRHGDPLGGGVPRGARLKWLRANSTYEGKDCLIWPFAISKDTGYGLMVANGAGSNAHRVMCEMAHGKSPYPDYDAAHSCRNRACCNPRHLRWASRSENMMDKVRDGTDNRGEKNHKAKLTEEDVRSIRSLRGRESQREIARRFRVDQSTVCYIQTGKDWNWLT